MDSFQYLMSGFATAMQPTNLMFAFLGCFLGTFIGVIPGIGPGPTIAILIPITYALDVTPSIILLAAIYYGSMYGGTITSVLMNVPGDASATVACFDGHPMAKQGRAGPALAIAAIGSFIGGTFAIMTLVLVAAPLTSFALSFGPPEIFALIVFAMSLTTALAGKSVVRGGIAACLGLLVASVGTDPVMGAPRFTFHNPTLLSGFDRVSIVIGLVGLSEILLSADEAAGKIMTTSLRSLIPTRKDISDSVGPILRGSGIGILTGLLPGVGAMGAIFMAYAAEKSLSKTPEKFGTGMIEGVAAPETANNACADSALIPLFTLGIPGSPVVAILMGGFLIHGVTPGPFLFKEHPDMVWAIIASLYIGNVMLLILNLPVIPLWVAILRIPTGILFSVILGFCVIGAYGARGDMFDVGVMIAAAVLGYFFKKVDLPVGPLVMTMILTPMMEQGLRRSLDMSQGDYSIFFTRPFTTVMLTIAFLFTFRPLFRGLLKATRTRVGQEAA